ncbi:hypothetical protein HYS50_00735 [Candidatus Woesearchaeota archaeon]|nr:hypothetical protein [Candidatus Woesearchaeota archaeon]
MGVTMKKIALIGALVLALVLGIEAVSAYMMYGYGYGQPYGYYPQRNYYMMDYYQRPYSSSSYNPYQYSYGPYSSYYGGSYFGGYYSSYYRDPYWKYYALDSFMRSPRYGFY